MTEETSETTKIPAGPPWKNESLHHTFEEADAIRQKLLRIWNGDSKHEGMQVKVKFLPSRQKFVVKTRLHPDFIQKKAKNNKKDGKNRKRNKKTADGRKFDASAIV